jgi:hypothetical protein
MNVSGYVCSDDPSVWSDGQVTPHCVGVVHSDYSGEGKETLLARLLEEYVQEAINNVNNYEVSVTVFPSKSH